MNNMRKQLLLIYFLCMSTVISLFCFSTPARAFPFTSPVHTHRERQSSLSPKPLSQEQSRFIKECINVELHYPKKVAYLTFDDGPNKYTPHILSILKKEKAKATFFVIGSQVSRYPHTMRLMLQHGHYLGLHSMSHNAGKLYNSDPELLLTEMEQTKDIVASVTGLQTHLVRVPYGSKPYLKQPYRDALANSHFKLWDWTIDTDDWKQTQTASSLVKNVINQSGRNVEVILMHDSAVTVKALPGIIAFLRKNGYEILPYSPDYHVEVNFWNDARF